MPLSDNKLSYFDRNVLRLPDDKREQYDQQVDWLSSNLKSKLNESTGIKVSNIIKAGSFGKRTILRKTNMDSVDVDLVFYISNRQDTKQQSDLLNEIFELLVSLYPTKSIEDFEIQQKATTVSFKGTGLNVDVVPVLQLNNNPEYGYHFDISEGNMILTCANCQIRFIRERQKIDKDFRTLIRLIKKWRNYAEVKPLKSYMVELIMAHLLDVGELNGKLEEKFLSFLRYLVESQLKDRIVFNGNPPATIQSDTVVIIDPFCNDNNVANRIDENDRQLIVNQALSAWETCHFASVEDDISLWKEVFGPQFKVEEN